MATYKFITTKQRSDLMSKIKSNNTTPEVMLCKMLRGEGIRFSRNANGLPGKPDIVLGKCKVAIFIDGEFWHGYNWMRKKRTIKSNRSYWIPKIERNIKRDKEANHILKKMGWSAVRFWQHSIENNANKCVNKIVALVKVKKYA